MSSIQDTQSLPTATSLSFREAVQQVSAIAHARLSPELHGHLERATALVLHRHVWLGEDGRHAQVLSSDGQTWYRVNGACTCMDAPKAPQGYCKHKLAVQLYKRAGEVLAASSGARPQGTAAAPSCPEALFSACLKGTVRGIDTQLTARGQTLEEFQRNFDAVHALFDAPAERTASETPAPASAGGGETPKCLYHGPMKASTKAPGTFFCTKKLADQSYCPSRYPER